MRCDGDGVVIVDSEGEEEQRNISKFQISRYCGIFSSISPSRHFTWTT
jgi:hypothetical protein